MVNRHRDKLIEMLPEDYYPRAGERRLDIWVTEFVLGLDPNTVVRNGFTKKKYKIFFLDADGKRIFNEKLGENLTVIRKFTPQQRTALARWWPLLSDQIKSGF